MKKNLLNSTSVEERHEMLDREEQGLTVKKQAELLEVNRTSVYYQPVKKKDDDIEIQWCNTMRFRPPPSAPNLENHGFQGTTQTLIKHTKFSPFIMLNKQTEGFILRIKRWGK